MSTQQDADIINAAQADPAPFIHTPESLQTELIRGIGVADDNENIEWQTVANVRELNGADEEYLATVEKRKDTTYVEYMNALLTRAVLNIGTIDVQATPGAINKLILADREMLFLGVLRATYGRTRTFRAQCQHCGEINDVEIDLEEDFPIVKPDFDPREPIEIKLRKGGSVKLRLPNGEDTIAANKADTQSDAELNTFMLSRCALIDKDGDEALEWAKNLSLVDRRQLVQALLDVKIGPSLEGVDTQCVECEKDMRILLDWVSLLLS